MAAISTAYKFPKRPHVNKAKASPGSAVKLSIDLPPYTRTSPSMLAQQPSELPEQENASKEKADWQTLRGHLEARRAQLYAWRSSWWMTNWAPLAEYIDPSRSIWLTQSAGGLPTPNNMSRGRQINNAIVDPTGMYAKRVCAAGLMSGLASPSRPWFKVKTYTHATLDAESLAWLDIVEERMYTVMGNSNFYNSFAMECNDLTVYGTAPVLTYEDDRDIIRCYNPSVGEYYLGSDGTNRVNSLYRSFVMTILQIVDFFGLENCPENVRKLWQQKGSALDTELIVAHSIEPNFEIATGHVGQVKGNFAWREVYWLYGQASERPLSIRGFVDQPFAAPRWSTQSNDAYGRSVGMDVLPDIVQLQFETRRKAEGIEKQVRPPLQGGMELKNQPSSSLPGSVTYVSDVERNGLRSIYTVNPDLSAMERDLAAIQQRINKGFFVDLFLMMENLAGKNMTATEVQAHLVEKMTVLGPVVENILSESLRPRLKRVYQIMFRKGLFPPMPKGLKGIPLNIEFTSLLAVAQRASATSGMERLASIIGNMVAVYPDIKDNLDPDRFLREFNDLLANPHDILLAEKRVQQMRAARQKQQQAQTAMAAAQHGAQTANIGAQAAQTLANTQVGAGRTALQNLMTPAVGA